MNAPQCYVIPTMPNLFLLFLPFYSIFLLVLCKLETFLDLVSDFPDEEMATVLRMKRYIVKTCVRYRTHDCNVGIVLLFQ